jgi:hypothetical protein
MKYIKLYEDWNMVHQPGKYKYNAGDYVILDNSDPDKQWKVNLCAKILDNNSNQNRHYEKPNIDYYIETFLLENQMINNFWVDEEEIERLATTEEIEDYELKIAANKYNI